MKSISAFLLSGFLASQALAQDLLAPPLGSPQTDPLTNRWRLAAGQGKWIPSAEGGSGGLQVTGDGEDTGFWRAAVLSLKPGHLYRMRFEGRRLPGASGGTAVSGVERVNRDFTLTPEWQTWDYVFRTPDPAAGGFLRLGQWHANGSMEFRNVELWPVEAVHRRISPGQVLGEAESVENGEYRFNPFLGWAGANYHRTLVTNRAGFNSDRWVFGPGEEIVYRLQAPGARQKSARLRIAINYYDGGRLMVEAGRDGREWRAVATLEGDTRAGAWDLPAELFPGQAVYVRLRHGGTTGAFQVNTIDYRAPLEGQPADATGETGFMDVLQTSPPIAVKLEGVELSRDRKAWQATLAVTPAPKTLSSIRVAAGLQVPGGPAFAATGSTVVGWTPAPKGDPAKREASPTNVVARLDCPVGPPGNQFLTLRCETPDGTVLWWGRIPLRIGFLDDPRPGYRLAGIGNTELWWCESGWKIGRERAAPSPTTESLGATESVQLSLAGGEYEPVQVVLRPRQATRLLGVDWQPAGDDRAGTNAITARIERVEYVPVVRPTDGTCLPGWYPDPLPPLHLPWELRAEENQPLWITFHAPAGTRAGAHGGVLTFKTADSQWRVPVRLTVYGFDLPRETHLRSALGLGTHAINEYHGLTRPEDQRAVYEEYLSNFAAHRISPYSFFDYAPIGLSFKGEGTHRHAVLDFSRFDRAAEKWLDEAKFSTFRLDVQGMGGGTYQSRALGRLEGFEEGTPEHARLFRDYLSQVERHLRERGWLDKAFTYWFDEPDTKDYEFVVAGMKRLKAAAPGLKRLLTEQPEPALLGNVDIWCGLTPEWTRERVQARRAAGEQVWWYICCAPQAPYATEFIDHPGTELRLWPWQSWQYGVNGILIWETLYWTSPLVYPRPKRQDPYADAMSYVSGYDYPVGHVGYWGNGDGRFLYPPRAATGDSTAPCLEPPVNSVRWENLRDGMEDYEYFWLLEREVLRRENSGGATEQTREARALLRLPEEVSRDLTHFTTDPRVLLRHRERVARTIEALRREP